MCPYRGVIRRVRKPLRTYRFIDASAEEEAWNQPLRRFRTASGGSLLAATTSIAELHAGVTRGPAVPTYAAKPMSSRF
jgi:hypothetical protein